MNGNPVTVTVNILQIKTSRPITTENIHVSYQFLPHHRIKFTFDIKFYGDDDIVYQSHAVIDISKSNNPESNRSLISRAPQSIKTPADADVLGFIDFTFNISEQRRPARSNGSPTTTGRRNSHGSPSSSSSDLLFLGLLIVGVAVAGLGIGMSSV